MALILKKPNLENAQNCEGCKNLKRIVDGYYDKETKTKKSFENVLNNVKDKK